MALRYWVAGGTENWNSTTNWSTTSGGASGASVPGTADDAIFNANSGAGNVIINVVTSAVLSINFTGFVGTLRVNNVLSSRNVTLGTGMSFDTTGGTPILRLGGTGTYTSNGVTWPYTLVTGGGAYVITFNGNATVQNFDRRSSGTAQLTLNGDNLIINGDLTFSGASTNVTTGTTNIVLAGTGTWSQVGTGAWRNNLTINTTGTITLGTTIRYNTGTITYTSGTVITTGSTLNIVLSTTLNTDGIIWNGITLSGNTTVITLGSDLTLTGTLFMSTSAKISFIL
jgi:hypothetical protein